MVAAMPRRNKLEKLLTIDKRIAVRLFIAETAAVLTHNAISFVFKKEEPVFFLLAAFIIPGYLLTALLVRAFVAAQKS